MKVLVGVDGSSNSLATISFAGRLFSIARDDLIFAHVSPPSPYLSEDQLDPAIVARAQAALSSAVFDEAVSRLPDEWRSRVQRAELSGSPSAGLLELADERGVDLIAVGFRGTGLFERFLLGSVSRAVVHSARVPVLVVKTAGGPDREKLAGVKDGVLRVLATYDGPEAGALIADVAEKFAWPPSARGDVITVVLPMFVHELPDWLEPIKRDADVQAMAEAWQKECDQQVAQAADELRKFQQLLPAIFHGGTPIVAQGRPAEQILAAARRGNADLIVVGGRGRGAVERLLLGSTSAQIVNQAPCPVLVAR